MLTKSKNGVHSQRSPPKNGENEKAAENELKLDKTQESSRSTRKSGKKLKRSDSKCVLLSSYSTRRVRYKKTEKNEEDEDAVNIDREMIRNDRTLRDEDWFLEKIEKCKSKRLERTCCCPLSTCYQVTDWLSNMKVKFNRIRWALFMICCPPCCCVLQRAAFWPPPREYYFFIPPVDDIPIEVYDTDDAIRMKERKKRLTKVKKARKCVIGEKYKLGLSHPCVDDIKHVEGFMVKTARKNKLGCIYIPCPDNRRPRFTLLYSHPNGSDLSDHLVGCPSLVDVARFYRCDVYSYDYSGFGISSGTPCESNMYADIRAVYEYITVEKKIEPKNIVLHGYSIGSAATIELLRHEQERKPAGVILQSPPASLLRVIGNWMGRSGHLDKPTCCLDRFATIDKIHEVQVPILIIHGKDDKTVPIEHGEILCQRAVTKVIPEWVPETSHDNIENCRTVWRRIRKFVKEELKFQEEVKKKENRKKMISNSCLRSGCGGDVVDFLEIFE